jgi:hypothetical protein
MSPRGCRRECNGAASTSTRRAQELLDTLQERDRAWPASAACRAAHPNPEALARWLIDLELDGHGGPEVAPYDYRESLGPHGQ